MTDGLSAHRPLISIGSVVGFITTILTVAVAIVGATLWLGNLDRGVTDTVGRVERVERDTSAFQTEIRSKLETIQQQIVAVQIVLAKQPDAQPRRR